MRQTGIGISTTQYLPRVTQGAKALTPLALAGSKSLRRHIAFEIHNRKDLRISGAGIAAYI
jgi:hypothetical protein